jgi:hypothetical protein
VKLGLVKNKRAGLCIYFAKPIQFFVRSVYFFVLKQKSNKKIQGCIKIAKIYPIALRRKSYAAAYTHD